MESPTSTQSLSPSIELEDFRAYWTQLHSSEDVTGIRLDSNNPSPPATPQTADIEANELSDQVEGAIFSSFIIALFIMIWYSHKNAGLLSGGLRFDNLWRLGSTAVLTILSIFWARVELHSKRYMPWIWAFHAETPDMVDYDLDYMSMMLPTILVKSLRQKHYLVFLVAVISLLLKTQIVLAPGLFLVTRVQFQQPIDVKVLHTFNTEPDTIQEDDTRAYYTTQSIQRFNASFPFGVVKGAAYQLFSPRGRSHAPVSVTVDAFFVDMSCLKLGTYNFSLRRGESMSPGMYDFNFGFEGCDDVSFHVACPVPLIEHSDDYSVSVFPMKSHKPCPRFSQRGNQFVYVAFNRDFVDYLKVSDFAAVICSPRTWISKVEVIDDGTSPVLEVLFDCLIQLAEYSGPLVIHYGLRRANEHSEVSVLNMLTQREATTFDRLDLSMLDTVGPHALFMSFRLRIWAVSLSQVVSFFCAFLTVASSTLFTLEHVPESLDLQLQQRSWFGDRPHGYSFQQHRNNRQALSSMLLQTIRGNITYPKNTFDDLVFPILSNISAVDSEAAMNIVPFAKLLDSEENMFETSAYIFCVNKTPTKSEEQELAFSPSLTQTYLWGAWDQKENKFSFLRLWKCHYSWVRLNVTVNMVLSDGEWVIDLNNPPRPDLSTTMPWDESFSVPYFETDVKLKYSGPDLPMGCPFPIVKEYDTEDSAIDLTFRFLVEPHGPIPADAFSDPGQEQNILDELNHNRALISAQLANLESRFGIEERSNSTALPPKSLDPVNAVLIDYNNRRIVQNKVETYIITAILGLVTAANILALLSSLLRRWRPLTRGGIFDMDVKGLAPKDFQSISMTAALLESSNATEHIPIETQSLSRGECDVVLSGLRFRLGNEENVIYEGHDESESLR
ncbi:hypothetical protein CPLU01_02252 [Colletotrichum plurivorum]|uniref:Uncharacterized protein n=1 Tax=Colletotrichum plurivorum TaxID=2175906 RepID=A0A8H6KW08_9PEZI|nr:hypothetical protein CPLU01_02252 [Colletotrichum plurivorum]